MTDREYELLGNLFDALDRLFDWDCGASDVWTLLVATATALHDTPHRPALEQPMGDLKAVAMSEATNEAQRDHALSVTDPLRQYLADVLAWGPSLLPGGQNA